MLPFIIYISLAGLFYIYIGYPALMVVLARLLGRVVRCGPFRGRASMVISVYQEAGKLGPKLRSVLEDPASACLSDIWVGSDGSPEDVESVVAGLKDDRIHVVRFPQRRGKPSVLNDLVPRCQGEIVILTDARQPFALGALAALLENFADSSIGVVSGELVFRTDVEDSSAARGIDAYWRYEKMIRKAESRFRSVPGATGACYAIRRELFMPIPAATLLDDVAIPMQAMARGVRCVFEERAVVYDAPAQSSAQEAVRKRRTIAGNAQLALLRPRWLLPWGHPIWFEFISHKLLRLFSPFFLVAAAVGCALSLDDPAFRALGVLQAVFYLVAAFGWIGQKWGCRMGLVGVPYMFLLLNLTTLAAWLDFVRGRFAVTWQRVH